MPMLDVFNDDAFSVTNLTDAINKVKFVPGRISQLGLFSETGVATTTIAIEEKNGVLALVAPTPRGGPGTTLDKGKRNLRSLAIPHFEINDAVMADEVQGIRAFGSETDVEMVMGKIAERDVIHTQSFAATQEYSRLGAMKGVVTYADGTTLDLFNLFGVNQIGEIDLDLDNANPASGALRKACAGIVRSIAGELDGLPFNGVLAECGDALFDDLLAHPEVVNSYRNTPMAEVLRQGYVLPNGDKIYGAFEFGGIVWENYRGRVGNTDFIDTNKAHMAPLGVPGLFRTVYAPADYVETVNTIGQRLYQQQYEMQNHKGVHLDTQMNAVEYCTRPRTLIKAKRT